MANIDTTDTWRTPRAELIAAVGAFMGVTPAEVTMAWCDVMDTDDADIKAGGNALCIAIRAAYSGDDDYDELGHELEHVLELCERTPDDMCVMLADDN